jgi:hypothetical protein
MCLLGRRWGQIFHQLQGFRSWTVSSSCLSTWDSLSDDRECEQQGISVSRVMGGGGGAPICACGGAPIRALSSCACGRLRGAVADGPGSMHPQLGNREYPYGARGGKPQNGAGG